VNTDINRFHGVVVITPDFESGNLGSNPGGTYLFFRNKQIIDDMPFKSSKLLEKYKLDLSSYV
jgi:hypothetical protein